MRFEIPRLYISWSTLLILSIIEFSVPTSSWGTMPSRDNLTRVVTESLAFVTFTELDGPAWKQVFSREF